MTGETTPTPGRRDRSAALETLRSIMRAKDFWGSTFGDSDQCLHPPPEPKWVPLAPGEVREIAGAPGEFWRMCSPDGVNLVIECLPLPTPE